MKIRVGASVFIIFLLSLAINPAWAGPLRKDRTLWGELSLSGRVAQVNEEYRFVIINLGSADGVKKGMVFSVFQKDEEAAKIKVAKVRKHISACKIELVYTGKGIGAGDIAIYKGISPVVKMLRPLEPNRIVDVEPIVVDIDAPKRTILSETQKVFKEFGIIVTALDLQAYTINGHKYSVNPFNVELLTEWGPNVRNKIIYTAEVSTTPRYNRLIIRLRGVYDTEGMLYNHEINKTSATYREVQEMAFTIKDLSEGF